MITNILRPFTFILILFVMLFFCVLLMCFKVCGAKKFCRFLQKVSYKAVLKVWGVKLRVEGELSAPPVLLVANHCSYIDIPILGAIGAMRFTPKSDVRSWPVIGVIPIAYDVIFVDRTPSKAKKAQQDLLSALKGGDRICVFPEGTTNDGRHLKAFKPTLFSLAELWDQEQPLKVQPLTICYEHVNGEPMNHSLWDRVAWFGDADLVSHMWAFAALRNMHVTVYCHDVTTLSVDESRKDLSQRAREMILTKLPHLQEKA